MALQIEVLNKRTVNFKSKRDGSDQAFDVYGGVLKNGSGSVVGEFSLPKGHDAIVMGKVYDVTVTPDVYQGRITFKLTKLQLAPAR